MPTSSIPVLPSDTVPAIATAATNFISSVAGPFELIVGLAVAFVLMEILIRQFQGSTIEESTDIHDEDPFDF